MDPGGASQRSQCWALGLLLAAMVGCQDKGPGPGCSGGSLDADLVGQWTVSAGPDSFWTGGIMTFASDGSFFRMHPTAPVISTNGCWQVAGEGDLLFATQRLRLYGYVDADVPATYSLAGDSLTIVEGAGWWGGAVAWTLARDDRARQN